MSKITQILSSKKFMMVLAFLGLYLLSTGISWAVFSYLREEPSIQFASDNLAESRSRINLDLPRTEECPINGGMFTQIERDIWEKRRPITVVLENHLDSRPTSGISRADVVYEAVSEGGITRFLAVFYCGTSAEDVKIAPVRSARVYYIDWAAEYGDKPIFMHVGGANNYSGSGDTTREARALELLETLGWRVPKGNDFDTTYDSGFPVFWRDYERLGRPLATEHTMVSALDSAYEEAERRSLGSKDEDGTDWDETFIPWKFIDGSSNGSPTATDISLEFWTDYEDYDVNWKYDREKNNYLRFNGGKEYIDMFDNSQVSASVVIVAFTRERGPVDRNKHLLYTTVGKGEALVFQNGEVIEGTWEKKTGTSRTKFFDESGKEISLVRGPIWIEIVPAGKEVTY